MKKEFVGFVPGLLGVEDFVDYKEPEKLSLLRSAFAEPVFMPYQTADKRAPDYDTMCLIVKNAIVDQQRINGTNGKIIASSVGAAVLLGALQLLKEGKHPLPDVILIGPVWDIPQTVKKMAGAHVNSLLDGKIKSLPIPVTGVNAGSFPLTKEYFLQAQKALAKPLPQVPSLTILTSEDDQFCPPKQAQDIISAAAPKIDGGVVVWQGGHNENNTSRDNDILIALSRTLHLPNPLRMLANIWDRFDGSSAPHYLKRRAFREIRMTTPELLTPAEKQLKDARLNIMRRMRINPELPRPIVK